MKKYIVTMNQYGGCDYTIACGVDYKIFDAVDEQDLIGQLYTHEDGAEYSILGMLEWKSEGLSSVKYAELKTDLVDISEEYLRDYKKYLELKDKFSSK